MSVFGQPSPEAWDDELSGHAGSGHGAHGEHAEHGDDHAHNDGGEAAGADNAEAHDQQEEHAVSGETQPPTDAPAPASGELDADTPEPVQESDTPDAENVARSSTEEIPAEEIPADAVSAEAIAGDVRSAGGNAPDDGATFLSELARAMLAAAGNERARSAEETARRREAQVAAIRDRATQEAAALDERAELEIAEIGAWADAETDRIRLERETRIARRREELQQRLGEHHSLTERQVEAIDAALAEYRGRLDGFFANFDEQQDPEAIARFARSRPAFPELDTVAERARTAAAIEAAGGVQKIGEQPSSDAQISSQAEGDRGLVGVMEAPPPNDELGPPWPPPGIREPESAGVAARSSGALLGTVPARRPISSWLNRNRDRESGEEQD
jgi:hypothetical protein